MPNSDANQGGDCCKTGGSNDRGPDYYNVNVSIGIPAFANLVGWNMTVSVDRYGHAHISPFGIAVGKSLSPISYSVTANWLMQAQKPTEQQLNNFLTGHGFNFGGTLLVVVGQWEQVIIHHKWAEAIITPLRGNF